ncbi:MAG: LPS export ABC transporter permease LptF [Desulfocapsaceae bacterium]|nr:LPS export ABC transporter permease LptF [Desulfocapsaceae bacterium]
MNYFSPKPLLLYSYLAREMLAPFFASFIIMNCIFFLVKLIPFLDIVLEFDIQFADFIRSIAYLFPNMLLYSIPMAAMMGIIIGFTRLSNDAEILAFKACGVSLYRVLPPVFLVALIISSLAAYVSITLIPASEIAMKQLFYQLTKEKIDRGIKEKEFTAASGDLVVYVENIDKSTNEWQQVWVSDTRDKKTPTITLAQNGKMSTNIDTMTVTIDLFNGSLHRTDADQNQIILFDRYRVNIPVTLPSTSKTKVDRDSMSITQLRETAEQLGMYSERGRKYLTEYHKRLVLPVGCLIMSLMALPLGLQSGPGRRANGIPLGLCFFIIYYVLYTLSKTLARDSNILVGIAMWFPNIFFIGLAVAAIIRVANEKSLLPDILREKLIVILEKIEQRKSDKRNQD